MALIDLYKDRSYKYGEQIDYAIDLLTYEDKEKLKNFKCGKAPLDRYITQDIFTNGVLHCEDGLHYKVFDKDTDEIIGFVSLAASGLFYEVDNYSHMLPAVKIDVFAIDKKYQKLHIDEDSEKSDDHFYFSDAVMNDFIGKIIRLSEEQLLVQYIILYADVDAHRFYIRNGYNDFNQFMRPEKNMEIEQNIPMFYRLDS